MDFEGFWTAFWLVASGFGQGVVLLAVGLERFGGWSTARHDPKCRPKPTTISRKADSKLHLAF